MRKKTMGKELIESMEDAVGYMNGKRKGSVAHKINVPETINVPKIRRGMRLTPVQFAKKFGFSYKTLQHWERGDRRPTGPARILLAILEKEPNIVNKYLSNHSEPPKKMRA